jgi:hypothetical protein
MKNLLPFLFFTFSFTLQTFAQGDFEFNFYPTAQYKKYLERFDPDTTKATAQDSITSRTLKIDSSKVDIQVVVNKTGDLLTICDIRNPSPPLYSERVVFRGILEDGISSLLYQSRTDDGETVVVNPVRGFVVLSFKKCFIEEPGKLEPFTADTQVDQKPTFCNFINHYFGTVDLKKYIPDGLRN